MKALCLESVGNAKIKDIPYPVRVENNAIVKIQAVSICGSDVSAYRGKGMAVSYPLVLGHEVAGVIAEMGENESGLRCGDRVILDPYIYCKKCYPCSLGRTNCCESLKVLGVQTDGAMSEYVSHPVDLLHKVPDNIPWEVVPLAEPLVISLHALHRTRLAAGEKIAVIGAGAIGLLAAMAAKAYGAEPILIDILPDRLEFAKKLGIENTLNSSAVDVVEEIKRITGGRMAEVVVEASGSNQAIHNTLDYASYCGRVALTGWPSRETSLNTATITRKELEIFGSRTGAGEFGEALELISGNKVNAAAIISEVVKYNDLPDALERLSQRPSEYIKIVGLL